MAYTVEFNATGATKITVEKASRAKILNEALKSAGITPSITVNKVVDFNKPKRELTEAQRKAVENRKKSNKKK